MDHCTATKKKRKLTFEVKYRMFCRSKAFENAKKIIALQSWRKITVMTKEGTSKIDFLN